MLKSGLILDLTNLYYEVQSKHPGKRLRILSYVKALEAQGHTFMFKIAYSKQSKDAVQSFTHMLHCNGFETHFGSKSWAIAMALRTTQILPSIDSFVLGSNMEGMSRVLQYAREVGKLTKCFAINIPTLFNQFAECVEVSEDLMDEVPNKAQQVVLPSDSGGNGS